MNFIVKSYDNVPHRQDLYVLDDVGRPIIIKQLDIKKDDVLSCIGDCKKIDGLENIHNVTFVENIINSSTKTDSFNDIF